MSRRTAVASALLLAALRPLLVAAAWGTLAPASPPVEVGKVYGFGVGGADLAGRVLREPRGNWLEVEVRGGDGVRTVWLNLLQVSYVEPDPPARDGPPCCVAPLPAPAKEPSL
jgi:hypothetical protein